MVAPGIAFDVIFTDEGKRKDASTLYLKPIVDGSDLKETERVYGSQIGSLCTRFPGSCASNLKALLGKSVSDEAVRQYLETHPGVNIVGDHERNNTVMLQLGSGPNTYPFSTEELTGMSLNNLKQRVLKALATHPRARSVAEDVAVSVPPFADQVTRLAYLDALYLGEFSSILGLVDEGVAAALAYVNGRKFTPEEYDEKKSYHIIYDVGAGSTTATLFSFVPYKNKTITVDIESFGYDSSFGGEYLTHNVYDILYLKFLNQFSLDDSTKLPPKLTARLIEASEKAKTILSANNEYRVSLESFYDEKDFRAIITRQEFEDYSSDSTERAVKPIVDALNGSPDKLTISNIDSVILNGGSTRTPLIQKQLIALLGSENKISKVVNTDEACALGTTIRAYQLKMITTPSDIILKDRIFSNFEISINDSSDLDLVFSKGSEAGNRTEVSFGNLTDSIEISLYENSQLISTHPLTGLSKKAEELKCASDDVSIIGTFEVDNSKIFSLRDVILKCSNKSASATSSKSEASQLSSGTKSEETVVYDESYFNFTKRARGQLRVPISDVHFSNLRPLNNLEKKSITKKLRGLKAKDEEKIALQERKNELESMCYSLRSFLDDTFDDLIEETGEEALEEARTWVSEILEWIEYNADDATFDEIEFKKASVLAKKEKLSRVHKMVESDLSLPELQKMLDEGKGVKKDVQAYLKEYESQISSLKDKYAESGFDFSAEDEKILTKIYGLKHKDANALGDHFEHFLKALESLEKVVKLPAKKFKALTKEALFEASEGVTSLIYKMMDDVVSLQKKHEERLEFLMTRFEKLEQRQVQKEFRLKKKEAAEKEAADQAANQASETSGEEADKNEPVQENSESANTESSDPVEPQEQDPEAESDAEVDAEAEASDIDHDEL